MPNVMDAVEKSIIDLQIYTSSNQGERIGSSKQLQKGCRDYQELLSVTENAFAEYRKRFLEQNTTSPIAKLGYLGSKLAIAGSLVGLLGSKLNLYTKIATAEIANPHKAQLKKIDAISKLNTSLSLMALAGGAMELVGVATKVKPQDLLNDTKSKIVSDLMGEVWRSMASRENGSRLQRFCKEIKSNIAYPRDEDAVANELLKVRLCWLEAYIEFFSFEKKYLKRCEGTDVPSRMWMTFHKESAPMKSEVMENFGQRIDEISQISELFTLNLKSLSKDSWALDKLNGQESTMDFYSASQAAKENSTTSQAMTN